MLEIEEMGATEMHALLHQVGYGHLGCSYNNQPYVVPIHYAYDSSNIYFFTTEGQKTQYLSMNPKVCLQVEAIDNSSNWHSVIVTGKAELLTKQEDTEHALKCIRETNPTLTPALNNMWIDAWGRATKAAIYRIEPTLTSGRKTVPAGESRGLGG